MAFISIGGLQKVVEKLQHSDKNVQWTALDCIKALCVKGMIFCNFIACDFHCFQRISEKNSFLSMASKRHLRNFKIQTKMCGRLLLIASRYYVFMVWYFVFVMSVFQIFTVSQMRSKPHSFPSMAFKK